MLSRIRSVFAAAAAAAVLSACGKSFPDEPPEIYVSSEGKYVETVSEKLCWDDAIYCSASPYASAGSWLGKEGEPEYFPQGSVFYVELPEDVSVPDMIEISDVLIVSDGGMKNAETAAVNEIAPDIAEDHFTFSLSEHEKPKSYDPSRSLYRCIEITCGWGENECEYTFCVSEKPE